jgi:hypothetical protein
MKNKLLNISFILYFLSSILIANPVCAGESFSYMSDVIQCLGISYKAQSPSRDLTKAESPTAMMRMMISNRNDMQLAANIIEKYTKSDTELIKQSAESYHFFYTRMANIDDECIKYVEDLLNDPNASLAKPGTQAKKLGEITARGDELWSMFTDASMLAIYTIVDINRPENGKVNRLKINNDERQQLIRRLDTIFGNQIKGGVKVGQKPVIGSASFFYSFLKKSGWKSSDAK